VLLDRRTLRLLAGNCRLQQFNVELTQSLELVADVTLHPASVHCVFKLWSELGFCVTSVFIYLMCLKTHGESPMWEL